MKNEHIKPSKNAKSIIITLLALILGIATGLLLQYKAPKEVADTLSSYVFTPVYTMFMNALKMIVGPLVFCSIAASISSFSDLKTLGRIAAKIMALYVLTSAIAVFVGYFAWNLFPIGNPSLLDNIYADEAAETVKKAESTTVSILDTIVDIVPNNIIAPFQNSDMLELIFMAVILGLAVSSLSDKYPIVRDILVALDKVCSKITTIIVSFIPLTVFCSMAKTMISMNIKEFSNVVAWVPLIYFGDIMMMCVYMLLLLFLARLNPFRFVAKYHPAMLSAFTFASSNAALPSSIEKVDELGVSSTVYSFSLPLGATVNMDGSCVALIISALFYAKTYSVPVTSSVFTALFIAIIALSLGSPGVPGGNLVCIAILIPTIGVPPEAVSLIMGLYPLVGMITACTNVTGDAVVTTIAAKAEKLFDIEKFNS